MAPKLVAGAAVALVAVPGVAVDPYPEVVVVVCVGVGVAPTVCVCVCSWAGACVGATICVGVAVDLLWVASVDGSLTTVAVKAW